jgi:hypothetical protein
VLDQFVSNAPRKGFGWQIFRRAHSCPTFDSYNRARLVEYILAPSQNPKVSFSAQRTPLIPLSSQVSS